MSEVSYDHHDDQPRDRVADDESASGSETDAEVDLDAIEAEFDRIERSLANLDNEGGSNPDTDGDAVGSSTPDS